MIMYQWSSQIKTLQQSQYYVWGRSNLKTHNVISFCFKNRKNFWKWKTKQNKNTRTDEESRLWSCALSASNIKLLLLLSPFISSLPHPKCKQCSGDNHTGPSAPAQQEEQRWNMAGFFFSFESIHCHESVWDCCLIWLLWVQVSRQHQQHVL